MVPFSLFLEETLKTHKDHFKNKIFNFQTYLKICFSNINNKKITRENIIQLLPEKIDHGDKYLNQFKMVYFLRRKLASLSGYFVIPVNHTLRNINCHIFCIFFNQYFFFLWRWFHSSEYTPLAWLKNPSPSLFLG